MKRPFAKRKDHHGFTILELAMVITVVGLLLSFGFSAWISMKTSQQISAAKVTLESVANCLINYTVLSETVPPSSYYDKHCIAKDPWGQDIVYYNNGDDEEVAKVTTKDTIDATTTHANTAFLLVSSGPNKTVEVTTTTDEWDCTPGDDLCHTTSKNTLFYEINK